MVPASSAHKVTGLLLAWGQGDETALERLTPLVYDELRKIARRHLGHERSDHSLQATALINEAYLRLILMPQPEWQNRAHFFALSSRLMRRILVDFARSRRYQKRGGDVRRVTLNEELPIVEPGPGLVALDDALESLAKIDERKSRVVEMRFFGGLSAEEIAEVLNVSPKTVKRDWQMAKVWLFREMRKA